MFAPSCGQLFRTRLQTVARLGVQTGHTFNARFGNSLDTVGMLTPSLCRQVQRSNNGPNGWEYIRYFWRNLFGKYLLATNTISSGVLMVLGDMVAQEVQYQREKTIKQTSRYDVERILNMFIVGALQGPLHHYVYLWMDRLMPAPTFRNAIKKILIDQFVMSPVCIIIFFYSACYMERKSLRATHTELIEKFPIIYITDWMVWPAVQYINFRYLDTKYRVLFVNICTAMYNIFLSYMKHDYDLHLP